MTSSLLVSLLLPFVIPSKFFIEGMGSYKFGFPFPYIYIYQNEPSSMWFGTNLFNGNVGLSVNPLTFIINALIIYLVMQFVSQKSKKRKSRVTNIEKS